MTLRELTRDAATSEGRTVRRPPAGPAAWSDSKARCNARPRPWVGGEDGSEVCGHERPGPRQRSTPDAAGRPLYLEPKREHDQRFLQRAPDWATTAADGPGATDKS